MAYIGNDPSFANLYVNKYTYTATEGQTIFPAVYDSEVDVYFNGAKLQKDVDYTATDGVTIVLSEAAVAGDVIDIQGYFNMENFDINEYGGELDFNLLQNKPDPNIEVVLTGDVSGSANTTLADLANGSISISTTVADDSHNHDSTYLPLSGGTITGDLIVDGAFTINDGVEKTQWGRSYSVSNTVIGELLMNDGTSFINGGAYRVVGHIDATGTDQSSTAVFWNVNGIWYVNVAGQSGTSSNHIQFLVSGGVPSVKTYHSNNYNVKVYHERIGLQESTGTDNARFYYGADSYMSDIAGILKFEGSHTVWHSGNDGSGSGLDADLLDGQQGAYYQPASSALTTSTTFGGDVSGTYNAIVVADDSHNHSINTISDEHRLFNNMGDNHSTQTDFNAVSNFGARFVQGTTNGPGTGSEQFYGFTLGLGNQYALSQYALQLAIPRYIATDKYLSFRSKEGGTWSAWSKINAGQADKLTTARTLSLSGDVSGSTSFDGSGNASITATVADDSHNHSSSSGNFTVGGDLTVNGGDVTINNNNGGINFNDSSKYWLKTATNWGLYWNTTNNTMEFHGAGSSKVEIDLDNGNITSDGSLTAISKSFEIDHPTKEGKRLRYGSLEGPENGVYIRGKVEDSVIELPEYWVELVDKDSITVTLTPIGKHQKLYVEDIRDNKVYISNASLLNKKIKSFYVVYGERKDIPKLEVEID